MPHAEADLVASLIEEADFTASLGETLYQIARRVERENFSPAGRKLVDALMVEIADAMRVVTADPGASASACVRRPRAACPPSAACASAASPPARSCLPPTAAPSWPCWAAPSGRSS